MKANSVCQNASPFATRLSTFARTSVQWTLPVLVLLALLCGMTASLHAQAPYYGGITSSVSTALTDSEGMATDAAGNLYVAGTNGTTWTVYEFARTGVDTYNATPVPLPTPGPGYCASATAPCLRGIAFDSKGNLWVAAFNGGTGGQVYELTPTAGSFASSTPTAVGTGWVSPWGIAADKIGDVFVTDNTPNTITQITLGTTTVVNTGGVSAPRGIAVDAAGNLFVVNGNTTQVEEVVAPAFTTVNNNVSNGISGAGDLAFDANGNLWVSSYGNNAAAELSGWDTVTSTFALVHNWGYGLVGPVAVWPSIDGTMIVSDAGSGNGDGAISQINFQSPRAFTSVALGEPPSTQTLTFVFPAATTIAAVNVVTNGGSGTDFLNAGTGNCSATTFAANATCTVDVQFAPKTPGNRAGAVQLVDSLGNVAEAFLSGSATGPQVVFTPNLGNTLLAALSGGSTPQNIAVDGKNNIFVTDSAFGRVYEIPAGGGTPVQIDSSFSFGTPYGIAIDGAGNLFVGDTSSNKVYEVLAPAYTTVNVLPYVFMGAPAGLAVDASGNLFVADSPGGGTAAVEEATAVSGYSSHTTLISGASVSNPFGVAVDASGNVFFADKGTGQVTELSSTGTVLGTFGSFTAPTGVAVDPAGNLYVTDATGVSELTKATGYATTVTLLTSANSPTGIALDNSGNVLYSTATDTSVSEIQLASPTNPAIAFGNEAYQTPSAPQSITLSNNGNANLRFTSITLAPAADFANVGTGGDCVVGTPVVAAGECPLAITFTPQSVGTLITGTATLTDNAIPSPQVVNLNGTGVQATPTLSVTNSPVIYNAAPQAATVTGSVPGTVSNVLYNGSATVPTAVGTYAVTANFVPTDTTDYASLTASSAGSFVINKATPTLSISNPSVPYTGSPQSATVIGSVPGTPSNVLYNGSATVPTAAGTYAITANFTPSDTADYNSLTAASAGNFVIAKINPTLSVSNPSVTYNGSPQAATVIGSVPGTPSNVLYNGSATVPTAAGTYTITANFTPTDTTDYNTLTAASAGSFTINKATLTLSINNSPATYTGVGQSATIVATATGITGNVPGTPSAVLYNGSATLPIAAGSYAVTANFTPTDAADFNTVTAGSAGNFVIGKATPTLSVTNPTVTYNGNPQSATVTGSVPGTPSNVLYSGSATAPTAAGIYAITANFTPTDTTDYNSLTAASAGNFTIGKATPTLSVSNSPVNYTGTPQAAVVASSVPGTPSSVLYNGSATVPTAAGTYAITANFTPADTTNYSSLTAASAGNFTINTVAPTITFAVPNHTFGDAPFGVSATSNSTGAITYSVVSGPATIAGATVTLTGAGTVVLKATQAAAGNYTTGSQNASFTVSAGTPTITWAAPASIAYGTPLSATQLNATANVAGNFTYTPAAGTVLPAGNHTLSVTFNPTDTTNYQPSTKTTTITVTATGLTVSANNATRVYGAANPTFTGTITGAQNGDTFTESFTTTATTASNAGTYSIVPSATGTNLANYTVVINDGTLTITKANSTTSLTASGSSVNPGATVTLTATVASATTGTPTGSVSFYDGTTLLATSALSGGVATYSTTALAAGSSHTLTAVYAGDTNFNGSSTTSGVGITVGVLDFTLGTPTPANQTGSAGTAFTYSFNITPTYADYAGTVNFTASGLPAGAVATFSPASIPANGGPQTVTLILTTVSQSAALAKPSTVGRGLIPVALAFFFLPLFGTKRMRREGRRFGRLACMLLLVLAGLGATAALTGCGSHAGMSTNAQAYTVTITATSGAIQHTATVSLDLQQ